jgi:two-component system response regulator GlrR
MTREIPKVLLVDDDQDLLQLVAMRFAAVGYEVVTAASGEAALARLKVSRPHVVVTDLRMAGIDGMALFDAIRREAPDLPVIILTAHGTIPEAVAATRRGVFGFLTKPFDGGVLLDTVADALRLSSAPAGNSADWRADILTRSPAMEALLGQTRRVAASDAAACIVGASGTGKEMLARALHLASRRAHAPFVAANCGAIPEELLEAEFFGRRDDALRDSAVDRRGFFEAAQGGTLFLDEVGDLPLAFQARLVRAFEERAIRPLGQNEPIRIDVRVVSATQRKLEELVAAGDFREDLYYRLNVVKLALPALAERREDIPLLANHYLASLAQRAGKARLAFSPESMQTLVSAPWPGNVRQLIAVLEQAVALASTEVIPASLVRQAFGAADSSLTPLDEARRAFERDYLVRVLKITGGNVTQAARLAGRNRTEFYRLLDRHALEPAMFKASAAPRGNGG